MTRIADIALFLDDLAPSFLSEDWDNVGLLVGDASRTASSVMTCLTLTEDVAREAVARRAGLVVSHHPPLFRPVQRITADTPEGRVLLALIEAGIAVYSPHTSYDSARAGINQQLAETLGLADIFVLRPRPGQVEVAGVSPGERALVGGGRCGQVAAVISLRDFIAHVKERLGLASVQFVGSPDDRVSRVAVACGSAAEFLALAQRECCHVLVTGEARFHAALQARALGVALVLIGHYPSERPGVERLAQLIGTRFSDLTVWASDVETDPLHWT